MKVRTFTTKSISPVEIKNPLDKHIKYVGSKESFNFGLKLQNYNLFKDLKSVSSNYNTIYFLSDLANLESIAYLETPHTLEKVNKFTTYLNTNTGYYSYLGDDGVTLWMTGKSSFNKYDSRYFFTFNLSSNKYIYITKEYKGDTYYGFSNKGKILFSTLVPVLSSHLFEYVLNDNKMILYPFRDEAYPDQKLVLTHDSPFNFTCETLTTTAEKVFNINRNVLTKKKIPLKNTLSFYLSSYTKDSVELNLETTTTSVSNNYLSFGSIYTLKYHDKTEDAELGSRATLGVDILPLKNQATLEEYYSPNNHYSNETSDLNRVYEKIYTGTNQSQGYDKVYLSYNIGTKDLHFSPSKLSYFTTPASLSPYSVLSINDSKIGKLGAIAGNNPLLSDKIFKRRLDFKDNNFTDNINPVYLCSWLSGSEDGKTKWIDRYYNPDSANFSEAVTGTSFYETVTGNNKQEDILFDIDSQLTFEKNNDYAFYHIGERDYHNHISSLNKYNLIKDLQVLDKTGAQASYNLVKSDIELDLDGNRFAKFKSDHKGTMSLSFWLSASDYSKPIGYQLIGNYFEQGFAIFNTDLVTPDFLLPYGHKILLFNNDLEVYDEIELVDRGEKVNVKGIARKDNFNGFYVLGENNVIYSYNSNYNITSRITNLSGVSGISIEDIDVNRDEIVLSYSPLSGGGYLRYDSSTNTITENRTLSSEEVGKRSKVRINNFVGGAAAFYETDSRINTGNEIAFLDDNTPVIIKKNNPEKKNIPYNFVHVGEFVDNNTNAIHVSGGNLYSTVTNVIVDDEDNIVTLHNKNIITKLDKNRKYITSQTLSFLSRTSKKYIDVILDFEGNEYKKYYLLIEYTDTNTIIYKLDNNFNLLTTKNLGTIAINSLYLTKSITSYEFLKKTGAVKNKLKILLKTKPKITSTGTFKYNISEIVYDISQLKGGYNHFAVNIDLHEGKMELYVNGYRYYKRALQADTYMLDNPLGSGVFIGALSTPYFLTKAIRLQQTSKYFVKNVKIKGFRMYSKPLDYFEIRSHINYQNLNKDVVWSFPLGQRTYIDTIDKIYKFSLPEKYTNVFNIEIKNLGINDTNLKNKFKTKIAEEIKNLIPYYDELNEVKIDDYDSANLVYIDDEQVSINDINRTNDPIAINISETNVITKEYIEPETPPTPVTVNLDQEVALDNNVTPVETQEQISGPSVNETETSNVTVLPDDTETTISIPTITEPTIEEEPTLTIADDPIEIVPSETQTITTTTIVGTEPVIEETPAPVIQEPDPVIVVNPEPTVIQSEPEPVITQPEPTVTQQPIVEPEPEPVLTPEPKPDTYNIVEDEPIAYPQPEAVTPQPTLTRFESFVKNNIDKLNSLGLEKYDGETYRKISNIVNERVAYVFMPKTLTTNGLVHNYDSWHYNNRYLVNITGVSFRPWWENLRYIEGFSASKETYTAALNFKAESTNYDWNGQYVTTTENDSFVNGSRKITQAETNVTMITPQHGICAAHLPAVPGMSIHFYDNTGAAVERVIENAYILSQTPKQRYGNWSHNSDIMIVKLSEPVPTPRIKYYKMLRVTLEKGQSIPANSFPLIFNRGKGYTNNHPDFPTSDYSLNIQPNAELTYNGYVAYVDTANEKANNITNRTNDNFAAPFIYWGNNGDQIQQIDDSIIAKSAFGPPYAASGDSSGPYFTFYEDELIYLGSTLTPSKSPFAIKPEHEALIKTAIDAMGNPNNYYPEYVEIFKD